MESVSNTERQRAFTCKSLTAGLIGIAIIAGCSKIAPQLAKQSLLKHQLAIGVFFYMFLICSVWNPLMSRFFKKLEMSIREMSVVFTMSLAAGGFAWIGWLKQIYQQSVIIPQTAITNTRWGTYNVMNYLNRDWLANHGEYNENVVGRFINGSNANHEWIPFSKVFDSIPFSGWTNMIYWAIFLILISLMCLGMLMLVHRQWVRNEKLTYPLSGVAESMMIKENASDHVSALFRNKMFWISFAFVFLLHAYNYAVATWSTSGFAQITFVYPLNGLSSSIPIMGQSGAVALQTVRISFLLIGLAYFLAPALSLSIGLNAFVYLLFAVQVYKITGRAPLDYNVQTFRAGAYVAFMIMLVILGRRYYGQTFQKALFIGKSSEEDHIPVLGARLFLITALGSLLMMMYMGINFAFSLVMTLGIAIFYLVFTRIICETGIPSMDTPFMLSTIFTKMFGGGLIGPSNLMRIGSVSGVLFGDVKQSLMPYMATGMKISDDAGIKLRKVASILFISILFALGIAFFMHLWQYYSFGISDLQTKNTYWSYGISDGFNEISRMYINGNLDISAESSFWQRLSMYSPESDIMVYFILGQAAVFVTGFLRTRFLWWPFHAVVFCIMNTASANNIWASFLIGWFIRNLVVKFGGERNYLKMKPLFYGFIFAEICVCGLILLYGMIYYICNGISTTVSYEIL